MNSEQMSVYYNLGRSDEYKRMIDLLKSKGIIRESMLGDDLMVAYTAEEAIDITKAELRGEQK